MARRLCGCFLAVAIVPIAVILSALTETPVTTPYVHKAGSDDGAAAGGGSQGLGSGEMFNSIAWAYDIANRWMSLGLDQFWRRTMLDQCVQLEAGDHVLDLATGTADVALLEGHRLSELDPSGSKKGSVLGIDPSIEMLRHGVEKVAKSTLPDGLVRLSKGDAQDLSSYAPLGSSGDLSGQTGSLQSESIDKITMSFGIRNVPDRAKALREMHRILRKQKSSRVCILEFSLPSGRTLLSQVARGFITHAVPAIGAIATLGRGGTEYRYLEESIAKFPSPMEFAALMTREGLPVKSITEFAYGSVQLYTAGVQMEDSK